MFFWIFILVLNGQKKSANLFFLSKSKVYTRTKYYLFLIINDPASKSNKIWYFMIYFYPSLITFNIVLSVPPWTRIMRRQKKTVKKFTYSKIFQSNIEYYTKKMDKVSPIVNPTTDLPQNLIWELGWTTVMFFFLVEELSF